MPPEEIVVDDVAKKAAADEAARTAELERLEKENVSKAAEDYKRDMLKYKAELKSLKEKEAADETKKLQDAKKYKELYERADERAASAEKKNQALESSYLNDRKYGALKDAANKLGLKNEALADLEMVDLSGVEVETTSTGKVNILNADKVAERLKLTRPHWFGPGKPQKINAETPGVLSGETVSMTQVEEAEAKYKKSGSQVDHDTYKKILIQFRDQSRART